MLQSVLLCIKSKITKIDFAGGTDWSCKNSLTEQQSAREEHSKLFNSAEQSDNQNGSSNSDEMGYTSAHGHDLDFINKTLTECKSACVCV